MLGCPSRAFRRHIDLWEARLQREMLAGMEWQPLFCLVMPIGPERGAIQRARITMRSLAAQTYPHWRLRLLYCRQEADFDSLVAQLADGAATLPCLRRRAIARIDGGDALRQALIAGFEPLADRIGFFERGLDRALSDHFDESDTQTQTTPPFFITVLRPGDELSGDALTELAIESGLHRDADFLYSDEETRNAGSGHVEVYYKPDWSPDLLLATNYVGRLWCASASLLGRTGACAEDLLRRGEYDLVLRCTEQATAIRHLPAILCRSGEDQPTPANDEGALRDALRRRGLGASVEPGRVSGTYRVRRRVVDPPLVSIVICTRGARGLIKTCLETMHQVTRYPSWEVIAVENIPSAETDLKAWLRRTATQVIEIEDPFNWARFNNRGVEAAQGDVLVFLNDDVEITDPGWLDTLAAEAMRPEVGVVGPQLLYPNGTVQHAGMFIEPRFTGKHSFRDRGRDDPGYFGLALTQRNVAAVTGACLATRREVFERVGGFETAHQIVMNDLDYCLKVRRIGLLGVYTPFVTLIHHERASREYAPEHYDRALFRREWEAAFASGDPYHPSALSTRVEDMIADPEPVEPIGAGRPLFDHSDIRSIAILQLGPLEDAIAAVPAIRRLRALFPAATLVMVSGAGASAVWDMTPELDDVIPFEFYHRHPHLPRPGLVPQQIEVLAARLAPERLDIAVDLRPAPETRVLLRFAGARYTAGFNVDSRFGWLDIAREWRGDTAGKSRAQTLAEARIGLVEAIAAAAEEPGPVLVMPERPGLLRWPADLRSRAIVALYPGAARAIEQWPARYFAALIDQMIAADDVNIALLGDPGDKADIEAVAGGVGRGDRVWALPDPVPPDELSHFLTACALIVGNAGPAPQLAAALGVPTVLLHPGRSDPRETSPIGPRAIILRRHVTCAPCYLTDAGDCPRDLDCLTELRPSDVYPVCRRLLAIRRRPAGAGATGLETVPPNG